MARFRKYPERSTPPSKRLRRSSYPFLTEDPFDDEEDGNQTDWEALCCGYEELPGN